MKQVVDLTPYINSDEYKLKQKMMNDTKKDELKQKMINNTNEDTN